MRVAGNGRRVEVGAGLASDRSGSSVAVAGGGLSGAGDLAGGGLSGAGDLAGVEELAAIDAALAGPVAAAALVVEPQLVEAAAEAFVAAEAAGAPAAPAPVEDAAPPMGEIPVTDEQPVEDAEPVAEDIPVTDEQPVEDAEPAAADEPRAEGSSVADEAVDDGGTTAKRVVSNGSATDPVASDEPPAAPAAPVKPDDLTIIGGIGPKMAERLAGLGVTTFAQLAAWGAEDVERFESTLPVVQRGRLEREGWIDQARLIAAARS
jgi:NADH-quinone oxidoreductase subunit E